MDNSTLTAHGKPFHAVLDITPGPATDRKPSPGPAYSGRVEVWWSDATTYRIAVTSPDFTLQRTVVADKISETSTGTFYPNWLENFVNALIDPVPSLFNSPGAKFIPVRDLGGGMSTSASIERNDRTNGITNDLTYGHLGLKQLGSAQVIDYIVTLGSYLQFDDWKSFQHKTIPYIYKTSVLDMQPVIGRLSTLKPLSVADAATITVTEPTPPSKRVQTELVSTLKEESMLETAPTIHWPPVHQGKTDGYMIVYARTDRTGQVREAHLHNSDNAELELFGMMQAIHYKFKPLVVDGAAEQMEMPLVLHFTTEIKDPPLLFTVDQMKHRVQNCDLPPIPKGILSPDQHAIVRLSIRENGRVGSIHPNSPAPWAQFQKTELAVMFCTFRPETANGKPIAYDGDFEIPAKR
jgi:hypothetical protein